MNFVKSLATLLIPDGTPLPILAGPLRGCWWLTGAAPGPSKGLSVLFNRSETGQLREANRLAFRGSVCFDIGAHAGMYSLLFSLKAKKVYAFEPFPRNLAWLVRTLSLNNSGNLEVLPWAIAEQTGPTRFQAGAHNSEGRLDSDGDLPVFAISCDDFCASYGTKPHVIKIDVEGAETQVLNGARGILKNCAPALLLSTHGDKLKEDCFKILMDLGYRKIKALDCPRVEDANEFVCESD